jgi:tetratricopeptide (TPR) repeat protein
VARLVLLVCMLAGCATIKPPAPVAPDGNFLVQQGIALASQGDDLGAEQYFEAAIRAGYPAGPATRLMVGSCIAGGRLERARSHAQRYADSHPDDWIFQHVLASIAFAEGQGMQARVLLSMLLSDHPEHAPSQFLLGMVLRDQLGDIDEARGAFARYLELAPSGEHAEEARAWIRRAQFFPAARKSKGRPQ